MPKVINPKEIEVERYTEDDFDEMLNKCYETVKIGGIKFLPARILKECDPIGYSCAFNDYQEYDTKYECPECGEVHDDEDDAISCCQEVYECPECYNMYTLEDEAIKCCSSVKEEALEE